VNERTDKNTVKENENYGNINISRFVSSGRKIKDDEVKGNGEDKANTICIENNGDNNEYKTKIKTYGTPYKNETKQRYADINNDKSQTQQICNNNNNYSRQSPSCYFEQANASSPSRTNVLRSISPNKSQHSHSYINCCCHCCHKPCTCCSFQTQQRNALFTLLSDFITQDSKIEDTKESLAFCNDANLQDLFAFFDYSQTSRISPLDLCESLKELNVYLSIDELKMLFNRYDKNADGKLDYEEFCDMILPRKYSIAKLMNERYPPNYFMGFTKETQQHIVELFTGIISAEKSNERYRKQLQNYSTFDLFNLIKPKVSNGIHKEDLDLFMNDNGRYLTLFESELLFMRLDKDNDGVICYSEFLGEVASKL
jgi:calmodulin